MKGAILLAVLIGTVCIATATGHPGVLDDLGSFERARQAQQGILENACM